MRSRSMGINNTQERKWFESYNWNYEKITTKVVIIQRHNCGPISIAIAKMVIDYLRAEGIKGPDPDPKKKQDYCIVVDLVNKEFDLISPWLAGIMKREYGIFVAYPSQISQFIVTHRGSLVGRKFGL